MCLNRDVEYYSSNESLSDSQTLQLEWPFKHKNCPELIIACSTCYYPITFEEHIIHEIRNEIDISFGIVIPLSKLFRGVKIFGDNPLVQWRTEVYCPNCGIILSFLSAYGNYFTESNFAKIKYYINLDEQIVILWSNSLYRGSVIEARFRFDQTNKL